MSTSQPGRQRGLSLIELIIFMVVMGIAAVGVLQMLNLSAKASADPVRRKQALLLAESYMEEVQLARFTYCDPTDANATTATSVLGCTTGYQEGMGQEAVAGAVGRPFDNVSDYSANKLPQSAQQMFLTGGQLSDASGSPLAGLTGFTATVALDVVAAPSPFGPVANAGLNIPAGWRLTSGNSPAAMTVLRITIVVTYGTGPNDYVQLDGYRTRYAPNSVP
jgi:MSHA pilin protein MshD